MPLRDRISSLLILHPLGVDPIAVQAFTQQHKPGGLIFMSDNIGPTVADVRAVTLQAQNVELPMLMAVDQEGGTVSRLPGDVFGAGSDLAAQPVSATSDAFTSRAALLGEAGTNLNFGVIADVTSDPYSYIYPRVLGTDPASSAERVAAAVTAESNAGVMSTLKHFPGHGAAPGDSHTSLPSTDISFDTWRANDAVPFQAGIDAGAPLVMMGHLVYTQVDALPASLSPAWHAILRDDLDFDGVIVSDDMGMLENSGDPAFADRATNAIAALNAGSTMLVIVADGPILVAPEVLIDSLVAAVQDGRLPESVVNEAATRVMDLRLELLPTS